MLEHHTAVDRVFHALGDPVRRALVDRLSRGPASVSELARPFDLTLAAVVQHVQVLEQSGVIRTEKVGRVRTCRLEPEGLAAAESWIAQRRSLWERRFDRLGALLDEEADHDRSAPRPAPAPKKPRRQ
ncbi:MAG: helix-turn-helix transcriptional regulator [Myxococcales bacterium]|jgi:DNA-binding transcriptional ArsR family regulator|nr:helix-turn-helix transcriptional regulator [Myxococcales bacterium]